MAARKTHLRAADADEVPPAPEVPVSLEDAAARGDSRGMLVAMRNIIAAKVADPDTAGRDLASLTKRLMEVDRELKAFDAMRAREVEDRDSYGDVAFDPASLGLPASK